MFFAANRIPSGYRGTGLLTSVMRAAKSAGDADRLEKALGMYKERVGNDTRYARMIESYENVLGELRK